MAKHFGMRVIWNDWTGSATGDLPLEFDDLVSEIQNGFIRQFYVHPDSLHLLEPRDGDFFTKHWSKGMPSLFTYHTDGGAGFDERCRIIQRDGKPFYWPESEAA